MTARAELIARLREGIPADRWGGLDTTATLRTMCEAADALEALSTPTGEAGMREALAWYAEQAENCRKITHEGDTARHALDADGGKRARAALNPTRTDAPEGAR